MTRKAAQVLSQTSLTVPADEARQKIMDRIGKGRAILQIQITSEELLQQAQNDYSTWSDYNNELLKCIFSDK